MISLLLDIHMLYTNILLVLFLWRTLANPAEKELSPAILGESRMVDR